LAEKNPVYMGVHGVHVVYMQRLAYISATAEPNSMRPVPLESCDLMLFYGGKKSKVYIGNRLLLQG